MRWFLMNPSVRKNQDRLFNVFHELNVKDAVNYVEEVWTSGRARGGGGGGGSVIDVGLEQEVLFLFQGERRGSLEFIRNDSAFIDFKKKLDDDSASEAMPDIMANMADDHAPPRR